jgi:hypothetical protein
VGIQAENNRIIIVLHKTELPQLLSPSSSYVILACCQLSCSKSPSAGSLFEWSCGVDLHHTLHAISDKKPEFESKSRHGKKKKSLKGGEKRREEKREALLQRVCRGCPICLTYCSGGKLKGKSTIHSKRMNKFEKHPGPTPLKASAVEYHDGNI